MAVATAVMDGAGRSTMPRSTVSKLFVVVPDRQREVNFEFQRHDDPEIGRCGVSRQRFGQDLYVIRRPRRAWQQVIGPGYPDVTCQRFDFVRSDLCTRSRQRSHDRNHANCNPNSNTHSHLLQTRARSPQLLAGWVTASGASALSSSDQCQRTLAGVVEDGFRQDLSEPHRRPGSRFALIGAARFMAWLPQGTIAQLPASDGD